MTTTEIIEAEQLARWIDGERDTLPNEECAVALWVLRPDLAPDPKVSVADVLSKVTSGPFCEPKDVLMNCEDVEEDDFVDAIFAQSRTNISPSNLYKMFGIALNLDRSLQQRSPDHLKQKKKHTASPSLEDRVFKEPANNNRWWTRPWVAGGLAAAALVLFTLSPVSLKHRCLRIVYLRPLKQEAYRQTRSRLRLVCHRLNRYQRSLHLFRQTILLSLNQKSRVCGSLCYRSR